ncbi:MAG: peptidyl-prolyl cis-trans isomerase, partial [bacterium]
VRTQFGFHIIQKTGYKKEGLKSLEEVRDQIEQNLRSSESKIIAMKKAQRLFDRIEPFQTKLAELAQDAEMTVQTSDFFEPKTPPGLFGYAPNLSDILVNLEKDEISIPTETSVGVFLFEIAETRESHIPPFEEIENKVKTQYRNSTQADLARKKAETVHAFLLDNHTWEEASETFNIKTEKSGLVSREAGIPALKTDESVLDTLFEMKPGIISDVYTVYNNSFIFRVTEKIEFDQKAFESELPKLRRQSLIDRQHHAVDSWLEQRKRELTQQGKYKINIPAF